MAKKRIPKNLLDLIHVSIYIAILLLFANYEAGRKVKSTAPTATVAGSETYIGTNLSSPEPFQTFVK